MYINNAYLHNSISDIKDKRKPLIVTGCGTYRLYTRPKLPTWRPRGRLDYQLIYIASGKAHFHFGEEEQIITAGHMVLYRPKEPQKYEYYAKDQTEVYWLHFTGSDVKNILRSYGLTQERQIFYCGSGLEYQTYFRSIIQELQTKKESFEEMTEMYLRQIFIRMERYLLTTSMEEHRPVLEVIDQATLYFSEHYHENISIEEYAQSQNMSVSWFIRNFKQYTGMTPMQYVLSIRLQNAETLLANPQYNITEIANIIGYENPLYFSRIFRKQKGISPSEYRKNI